MLALISVSISLALKKSMKILRNKGLSNPMANIGEIQFLRVITNRKLTSTEQLQLQKYKYILV